MNMTACIGSAAMLLDWTHERTPESDEIQCVPSHSLRLALPLTLYARTCRIIPTLFPKDSCRLKFTERKPIVVSA